MCQESQNFKAISIINFRIVLVSSIILNHSLRTKSNTVQSFDSVLKQNFSKTIFTPKAYCDQCKSYVSITQTKTITQLPSLLCIQVNPEDLKRKNMNYVWNERNRWDCSPGCLRLTIFVMSWRLRLNTMKIAQKWAPSSMSPFLKCIETKGLLIWLVAKVRPLIMSWFRLLYWLLRYMRIIRMSLTWWVITSFFLLMANISLTQKYISSLFSWDNRRFQRNNGIYSMILPSIPWEKTKFSTLQKTGNFPSFSSTNNEETMNMKSLLIFHAIPSLCLQPISPSTTQH